MALIKHLKTTLFPRGLMKENRPPYFQESKSIIKIKARVTMTKETGTEINNKITYLRFKKG